MPPSQVESRAPQDVSDPPQVRRQQNLSETVAAVLGRRIVSSRYKPGETLPTEPQVQEEFGVSRTAVREAARLLSAKGLTVSRPKIGTRVRPMSEWNMLDPDVLRWHAEEDPSEAFIAALFEMRDIIEPAAAERAAERATPEQIEALEAAFDGIRNNPRGSPEQIQADVDFHMVLLDASRNPLLRSVGALIKSALELTFTLSWRTVMAEAAVIEHRDVLEHVREKRPEEAFLAMRRLLRSSRGVVFDEIWMARSAGTPLR